MDSKLSLLLRWSAIFAISSYSFKVSAALEYMEYTNNNSVKTHTVNNLEYINNQETVELYISAGLDRRISVTLSLNNNEIQQQTTGVVSTADRISAHGKQFYGKRLPLDIQEDGEYLLQIKTLGLDNSVISVDSYSFTRDTTAPVFPNEIQFVRAGYSLGSIEHFGNSHATKAIKLIGVADEESGIASAKYFAVPLDNDRQRIEKNVNLHTIDNTADITINAYDAANPATYPNDHYKIGFSVTDNAGNTSEIARESFIISQCPTDPVDIEVFNTNNSAWEPYRSSMLIYSNPVKVRWKRDKNSFSNDPAAPYGWDHTSMISNSDSQFNYYERSFPYPQNYSYFHFYTRSGKVCYTYHLRNLKFSLADGVGLAPKYNGVHYKSSLDPSVWVNSAHPKYNKPYSIPMVRIFAEARPYRQKAWGTGIDTCYIEPGQTSCDAATDVNYSTGRGYSPRPIYLSKEDGTLTIHGGYLYTFWDFNSIDINAMSYNTAERKIRISITDNDTVSDWRSYMWTIASHSLTYSKNGDDETVISNSTTEILDFQNRNITYDISSLTDGDYTFRFNVTDTYGNKSFTTISEIIDNTEPDIQIFNKDLPLGEVVNELNDIVIKIDDFSETQLVSARLFGSQSNENVYLPIIRNTDPNGNIRYQVDKPRIFPTLLKDEKYGLELTAIDSYSNQAVKAVTFKYIPSNLITLKKQTLLPVAYKQKDVADKSIATISSSNPLTIEGGMLATGIQFATITNRATSDYAIALDTAEGPVTIPVGETREIKIDLGETGKNLQVDLYPAENNVTGEAQLLFDIQNLRSKWQ